MVETMEMGRSSSIDGVAEGNPKDGHGLIFKQMLFLRGLCVADGEQETTPAFFRHLGFSPLVEHQVGNHHKVVSQRLISVR